MRVWRSLIPLLAFATATSAQSADLIGMHGIGDTRYHQVEATSIERSYHIYVGLPDGYAESGDKKYPTVYLLDGGALFPMLSAYYRYLNFGEEAPDMILVGISYGTSDWKNGNNRSRDYTAPSDEREHWGGAADFQAFLSDELIPLVEKTYRSRSDRRVVFGQSIGGQFVLYTALTQPDLFWGHIASNPALHRNLPFFLRKPDATVPASDSRLFVGSGSHDERRFRKPALKWMEYWTGVEAKPWDLKAVTLDGHNHFSAPPATFRQGIRWLFSGR